MPYLALYRKYRPQTFADVRGQEHIVSILQSEIKSGALAHAYLFAGSRGTGKTSVARIFAREVGTHEHDLIEIDAASNRGIDDVRALRDGVATLPFQSPYKVYIVDEVHMLTKEAFNALLKTLEEPPRHVIFILATTEMEKLPETVVSRCQLFIFKKPSQKLLADLVCSVARQEGRFLDDASADLIAVLGDGSFRDTHGMLEKVLSVHTEKEIAYAAVAQTLGAPRGEFVNRVVTALAERDLSLGLRAVHDAERAGVDMRVFLRLLVHKMRALLLLRFAKEADADVSRIFSSDELILFREFARRKDLPITSQTLVALLQALEETPRAFIAQLPLELALIRLLGSTDDIPVVSLPLSSESVSPLSVQ